MDLTTEDTDDAEVLPGSHLSCYVTIVTNSAVEVVFGPQSATANSEVWRSNYSGS
jgi:hypothetical protein